MRSEPWADEVLEQGKALFLAGLTMKEIAKSLNEMFPVTLTRNAVIGKFKRAGLSRPTAEKLVRQIELARQTRAAKKIGNRRRVKPTAPKRAPETVPAHEHRVLIWELENWHCRFPMFRGDEHPREKWYCGFPTADVNGGKPYCSHHRRITSNGVPR